MPANLGELLEGEDDFPLSRLPAKANSPSPEREGKALAFQEEEEEAGAMDDDMEHGGGKSSASASYVRPEVAEKCGLAPNEGVDDEDAQVLDSLPPAYRNRF